jgi:hypothetical protein
MDYVLSILLSAYIVYMVRDIGKILRRIFNLLFSAE